MVALICNSRRDSGKNAVHSYYMIFVIVYTDVGACKCESVVGNVHFWSNETAIPLARLANLLSAVNFKMLEKSLKALYFVAYCDWTLSVWMIDFWLLLFSFGAMKLYFAERIRFTVGRNVQSLYSVSTEIESFIFKRPTRGHWNSSLHSPAYYPASNISECFIQKTSIPKIHDSVHKQKQQTL